MFNLYTRLGAFGLLLPALACGATENAPSSESEAAATAPPINIRRSLVVSNESILDQRFAFTRVLDQLAAQSGVAGLTGRALYQQWWDTQNDSAHAQGGAAHCDDEQDGNGATLNGYRLQCPRQEGLLAATNPGAPGADSYTPLALFNRFDLAPDDGAHCGEHRIVFGKRQLIPGADRNLIIFEAQMPNPNPTQGLNGCATIAGFWASLTAISDPAVRAQRLETFYFTGWNGLPPVISYAHFRHETGQIRTNQFMTLRNYLGEGILRQPWQLREFKLLPGCPGGVCVQQVTVKENPFGELFDDRSAQPTADDFRDHFIGEVAGLLPNDANTFAMHTPDTFNGGESTSQGSDNDYRAQLLAGTGAFRSQIQAELSRLGSALTPENIADRATATSCAGCHQLSNNRDLGGGLTFPASLGFVHVSETARVPCEAASSAQGQCFDTSPALDDVFLPARRDNLRAFLAGLPRPTPSPRVH